MQPIDVPLSEEQQRILAPMAECTDAFLLNWGFTDIGANHVEQLLAWFDRCVRWFLANASHQLLHRICWSSPWAARRRSTSWSRRMFWR